MEAEHWFIGPQLIGLIFVVVGFIQKRFPPKHINALYGYRMPSSMKNQQTWDEANCYSAKYMIKCGFILLIAGLVTAIVLSLIPMHEKLRTGINAILMITGAIGSCVLLLVYTEKHLSKTFDQQP